jgi:hypothetical protein
MLNNRNRFGSATAQPANRILSPTIDDIEGLEFLGNA